jgi:hypothetical protein
MFANRGASKRNRRGAHLPQDGQTIFMSQTMCGKLQVGHFDTMFLVGAAPRRDELDQFIPSWVFEGGSPRTTSSRRRMARVNL